ncbi:SMU1112c/YaeR family gloxylase I-like metalloprotein [Enterovibrio nigricans]|uniref:Glyoxylase I family protein n=1 Tax=Enterovibrio nigricans DSM 22720 TaxID=1121868 RepID=A0A1T4V6L8_9GAMM|nr:VOC family protein [Enterovibrio nigricans]PKF50108.1 VOC family protein [Enterovibrio nigricans]SKA60564.1 glyoxylase I family protein [Enterovibrio nigricans DSM 22720]
MSFLDGIHHVAIIVSDYHVSKQFYTKILQLPVTNETYRSERDSWKLDLQLPDGSQLEIFSFPNSPKRASYPEARGLRHLAFSVTDIEGAIAALGSHGVPTEPVRIDTLTNRKFTFFNDPDGLPLELYEA